MLSEKQGNYLVKLLISLNIKYKNKSEAQPVSLNLIQGPVKSACEAQQNN
jgi:hypothetical protein